MVIEKHEIASKLKNLKSVVASKTTIESMKGILFKNGTLYANNLEIGMSADLGIV